MSGDVPPSNPPSNTPPSDEDSVAEAAVEALDNALEDSMHSVDAGARYQARIALVTAVVALVSALLGPLVSLRINSDQIDSQRRSSTEQNQSERQQSSDEFVRGQRQTAYGDYLAAYNNTALDLVNYAGKFSSGSYPVAAVSKDLDSLVTSLKTVSADFYTVTLVGSRGTVDRASATYQAFGTAANVIIDFGGRRTSGERISADDVTAFQDKTQSDYRSLVAIALDFVKVARTDLDADAGTGAGAAPSTEPSTEPSTAPSTEPTPS